MSAISEFQRPLAARREPIVVRTAAVDDPGDLLTRLPAGPVVSWVRSGSGLVGWGELDRIELTGPDTIEAAEAWWAERRAAWIVEDEVNTPGSGPVLFGSVAFDRRTGTSIFVVPRVVLGHRDGVAWVTTYGGPAALPRPRPVQGPERVRYADGSGDAAEWTGAVAEAVRRIRAGELGKVVLARDLVAQTEPAVDPRYLLNRLAERYPSCWTFAVDGLIGATPELLVRRTGPEIFSRVLAGTESGPDAETLLRSAKNREEHVYAVRSVSDVLAGYCDDLDVPAEPSLLRLPNLTHLATEMSGKTSSDVSALRIAGALHPTAAVCGTPTEVALDLIPELERMDRGRYAGPVGWVDARGDGEWGIALRCAQVTGSTVRMYAGCGIVADSDPDRELTESQTKFVVVRDALEP